jgi:hypothetical protein
MLPRLVHVVQVRLGHEANVRAESLFGEVAVSTISGSRGQHRRRSTHPLPRLAQEIPGSGSRGQVNGVDP